MLILGRYSGQKIVINDDIFIYILDVVKNSVKIGFDAPKNVQIYREEIYKNILAERMHIDMHKEEVSKLNYNH